VIAVLPLAVALSAPLAPATSPAAVRLSGVALAERAVMRIAVRVFAVGDSAVRGPEQVGTPVLEREVAPGPFTLEVEATAFPVRVEVSAPDHLAAACTLLESRPRELPRVWLPAGQRTVIAVTAGGRAAAGALVRGDLEAGAPPAIGVWRAVVPTLATDAQGSVEVATPATGDLRVDAIDGEGHWGVAESSLPAAGPVRCELATGSIAVAVRTPLGEPLADARIAVAGAPAGAVAVSDAAGRASVFADARGSSVLVALGDGCAARAVAYPGTRKPVQLVCEPPVGLRVSWVGGGGELLVWPGWLPEALTGGAPLRLTGGAGELPYFGHGGRLEVWSAGTAGQRIDVEDDPGPLALRLTVAASVSGTVVDAGGTAASGIPVWRWTLPESVRSGRFRGARGVEMLERSVLPGDVTDARGRFAVSPLSPGLTRLVAVRPGRPPAGSAPLELAPGAREEVTLTLHDGTWLSVAVQDPEGRPLAGVAAELVPNPEAGGGRMVIRFGGGARRVTELLARGATDRDGKLTLSGVPTGAMKLYLTARGYVERAIDLAIPPLGLDAGVQVLEPGVDVLGRVVDERGNGLADADIRTGMMIGAFGAAVARSDAGGAFTVPDLPRSGETYLVAARGEGERSEPVRVALPPQGVVELVIKARRSLVGRVVDETSAAPVVGAMVSAERTARMQTGGGGMAFAFVSTESSGDAESDADGRFRLDSLAPGEYTLSATASSYRPLEQRVTIPENEAPRPVTLLLKPGLEVHGTVLDPSGSPAPGVMVEASPAARTGGGMSLGGGSRTTRSGDDGGFSIGGLDPGQVVLKAEAEDGATVREVVEAGRDEPVELRLENAGAIEGTVLTEDGSPVRGATVNGFGGRDRPLDTVQVDGGGAFSMRRVSPGQYQVWASAEGWAQAQAQVTVTAGQTAAVELTLKRGGTVAGRVLGLPAAELARCQVFSRGARGKPAADGSFTLSGVPLGRGEVAAFLLPEGKRRSVAVDIADASQVVEVEIDFARGVRLFGSVRRGGGAASGIIVDAGVTGAASGGSTTSDAQGAWELAGVEPGRVEVRALDRQIRVLAARQVEVSGDTRVDLEIGGGTLTGRVVALPDRSPIAGARVAATGGGSPSVGRDARTDGRGAFALEEMPDGEFTVRAEAEGYATAEARAAVSMGTGREVTLALEPEQRLRLIVRESDGGVPDQIQLLPVRAGRVDDPVWVTCDRDGRASVASLPAGAYTFLVSSGAGAALVALPVPNVETTVVLRATGTLRATVPVEETWRIRAVSAESGLAVPTNPWQNLGRGEWVEVRSGVLPLRVPAGAYLVQGVAPDGTSRERQVVVPPEGEAVAVLE